MSGARPNGEAARRGGLVPFTGSSNGRSNNNTNNNNGSVPNSAGYPNINSNKSGNFGGNAVPEDVKASSKRGNDQLWSNGSGAQTGAQGWSNGSSAKGSAPVWPDNQQQDTSTGPGTPVNQSNNNYNNKQTAAPAGPGGAAGYIQGSQSAPNGPGPQQQQQQPNWQRNNVQEGIPVDSSTNGQNNVGGGGGFAQGPAQGPQGAQRQGSGFITQGPQKGSMPKGDYVYYDGQGNQIQPGGPPQGANGSGHWTGSGSERHFHHHYYYNNQQQPQQQPPVGYPYDKKMEQKKKRRPGATALAAALIACWACTCCCHAPCGC